MWRSRGEGESTYQRCFCSLESEHVPPDVGFPRPEPKRRGLLPRVEIQRRNWHQTSLEWNGGADPSTTDRVATAGTSREALLPRSLLLPPNSAAQIEVSLDVQTESCTMS